MGLKFTKSLLSKKTKPELIELAESEGIDYDEDNTKAELIETLLEIEEVDDVEEDDSDEEVDDSEEEDDLELPEDDEEEVDEVVEVTTKKTTAKKTKYTEGGKADDGEKLLGAKEVATQIGTDAKTLRQFFRSGKSTITPVGAGGRYEFKESQIGDIKSEFEAWKASKPGRGAKAEGGTSTRRKRGEKAGPKPEDIIDEVEDIEELEEIEELDEDDLELED